MNVRSLLPIVFLCLSGPVFAQGFAGLGDTVDGYAMPQRGTPLVFPADHGAHPDYRIEWWYVTANLAGSDGTDYGVQWTLFRSALAPPDPADATVQPVSSSAEWRTRQLWMGHAALTTPDRHFVAERLARGDIGQAGVTAVPFGAVIDEWAMEGVDPNNVTLRAQGPDFAYDLTLVADGPLVKHGDRGYSVKSAQGQASYYYSQPFYRVTGTLSLPEGPVEVTGQAWMDREWSSQPLAEDQTGWDWFSLHFDAGTKLMGFRLRDDGDGFTSGTWITPDGTTTPLPDGAVIATPLERDTVAGRNVPIRWRVEVPDHNVDVTVEAINRKAWMDTLVSYWEGPVTVTGSHPGRGYLEMTGYE